MVSGLFCHPPYFSKKTRGSGNEVLANRIHNYRLKKLDPINKNTFQSQGNNVITFFFERCSNVIMLALNRLKIFLASTCHFFNVEKDVDLTLRSQNNVFFKIRKQCTK